jgi:hypothetical protein
MERSARADRIATETLRREINSVAETSRRLAFVLADGAGRWGGVPDIHRNPLEEYRDAMRPLLPPSLQEIVRTTRDLNQPIRELNRTKL